MCFISDKNYAVQNCSASNDKTNKNSDVHEWEVAVGEINYLNVNDSSNRTKGWNSINEK